MKLNLADVLDRVSKETRKLGGILVSRQIKALTAVIVDVINDKLGETQEYPGVPTRCPGCSGALGRCECKEDDKEKK